MAELIGLERALRQDVRGASARLLLQRNRHLSALQESVQDRFELFGGSEGVLPLESLLNKSSLSDVDAVLSSYDSAAVFFGWFINRPVFFYDGLFWFWKFDQYRHCVPEHLDSLHRIRERRDARALVDAYRRLIESDYHLTVLVAHHLCTSAYVRNGVGTATRLADYPEFADKIHIVGAVIDPTTDNAPVGERTHVLVSLSGSLAPLLSFDQNLAFARGILTFALEAFETLKIGLPWYFCCHPKLHESLGAEGRLRGLPQGFLVVPSFDYCKNLDMIRRAFALFISPGFSSIQEAAYFRTPVFFIPEQNGGQPAQLLMLREKGYDASCNWTVTDVLCAGRALISEDDVEELYRGIEALWSEQMRPARIASLERFKAVLQDSARRYLLVESQRNAVCDVFGNFDGAKQIVKHILEVI
jgi:hypothetical protein